MSWSEGLTLIELMIVVGIISALAAIAIPSYFSSRYKAKIAVAISEIKIIEKAVFRREAPMFKIADPTFLNSATPPDIIPLSALKPTLSRLNDLLDDSAASAASSKASSNSLA